MKPFLTLLLFWALPLHAAGAPFLWKVEGAKATHYFVGSVHLLPQQAQPLPQALEQAYLHSAALVFESDVEKLSDPQVQMQLLEAAQSARDLKSEVGMALYQRVRKRAVEMNMPPTFCDSYRAWFCSMTLEVLNFQKQGFESELGIDQQLYGRAAQDSKDVRWLEPLEQHLGLFTGMPPKLSAEFLSATLDEMDEGVVSPATLLKLWQDNDLAAVEKMNAEMKSEHPAAYERLLAGRNRNWLPQLAGMLKGSTPLLIVVGAAHYAGPDGLIALLKSRGYVLQPVEE